MNGNLTCDLVSWSQFYGLARRLALKIRVAGFQPDGIVAIARGGYVPARVLADYLDVMNLTSLRIEHYRGIQRSEEARVRDPLSADLMGRRVLVVDDVSDTGKTFQVAVDHIQERTSPAELRTAALHHKVVSSFVPDFYAMKIRKWRWITYPWALIEDLITFIKGIEASPDDLEGMTRLLERKHGICVPRQALQDALDLMRQADGQREN